MSSYDVISQFYDSVVADSAKKALWLKQLIRMHHPNAKSILELACGTASILKALATDYDVVGLDNSAGMLDVARQKLPHTLFFQADMSNFKLSRNFDVILCIYDSINHLLKFSEWQSMFANVARHLTPDGLFIFDMNTVEFLTKLNTMEPSVSGLSDNTMRISAEPDDNAITRLKIELLEKKEDGSTNTYKTDIPEMSFEIQKVQSALEKHFEILAKLSEQKLEDWTSTDNKIVFVCRLR